MEGRRCTAGGWDVSGAVCAISASRTAVNSGAARSVCPENHARHVPLTDRKENVQLVGANGGAIETFGDKDVGYTLQDGQNFAVQYTVAKVRRLVVSVSQAVNKGTSWVFSPAGSFMVRGAVTLAAPGKAELIREGELYFVNTAGLTLSRIHILPCRRC